MSRSRISITVIGVLALAACSADRIDPVSPSSTSSRSASSAAPARYVVMASNRGFAANFASQVAALGGTVEQLHSAAGIAVVSNLTPSAATQVRGITGVSDVQPDATFTLDAPLAAAHSDLSNVSANSALDPTTAILFGWQWNMRLIGADKAWAAGKLGDKQVTVAILDSGIDYDNRDLIGLVDLSRSASFALSDDTIAAKFPTRNKISDFNGHGTNVAAQVSSNGFAFAGVTSKTTLIGVKVLGASGSGTVSSVLNGVLWAADHGADVANMSLGGGFAKAGNGQLVSFINRVFNYASAKGMLVVVAAGNSATDLDRNGNVENTYCDVPQVVCVSAVGPGLATDDPNTPTFYTNFGRSAISVAAPGGNAVLASNGVPTTSQWLWGTDIASWVWSFCSKTEIDVVNGSATLPCASGSRITGEIGTSQASPHVAGLAALLVAELGHGRPSQIKAAILNSALDLGQPGTDPYYGRGRIDVAKALGL